MNEQLLAQRQAGLELLANLEQLGAVTSTALILPPGISWDQYEALGVALGRASRTMTWMIGDWINFGERKFGEKYAQAVEATGLRKETLMNYASTARRVPPEVRRPELTFGAHVEVAKLEPLDQIEWLERAVQNEWRREDLRERLNPRDLTRALDPAAELEEAARDVVRSAKLYGADYLVGRASFMQLCAALGEEA